MSLLSKISSIIVFVLLLFGLAHYIRQCYIKYRITPEILVNEKYIQTDEIPFPAVTICSPHIAQKDFIDVEKFLRNLSQNKTPTSEELAIMASLGQFCPHYLRAIEIAAYRDANLKVSDENVSENIRKVSPYANQTFYGCESNGTLTRKCEEKLSRSFTPLGSCFTFNTLDPKSIYSDDISSDFIRRSEHAGSEDVRSENAPQQSIRWSLERGYLTDEEFVEPLRSNEAKSLQVIVAVHQSEISNFCYNFANAFNIILHLPNEPATMSHTIHNFYFNKHKTMRITASVSSVDKSLLNFPLSERNCYFEDEKKLRFFKTYTLRSCLLECMTNVTLKICDCVPFFAPRNKDTKVCSFKDANCMSDIYKGWPLAYSKINGKIKGSPCDCLRTCTDIKYRIVSESLFDAISMQKPNHLPGSLYIAFTEDPIVETTNYVTYGFQNFICDIGGLAGLFLGFSFLTVYQMVLEILKVLNEKLPEITRKFVLASNRAFGRVKTIFRLDRPRNARNRQILFVLPYHN